MPKITQIYQLPANPPRYPESSVLVYIDGVKCRAVRERTWRAMGLKIGDEITCEELNERENFHWKRVYNTISWEKEKIRLAAVKVLIESISPKLEVRITGFGAGTTDFIKSHPKEAGKPDIEVYLKNNADVLLFVEVTGTERMRGHSYWIRPDKLEYAKNHPDEDVWVVLHFIEPEEKFVFIRPDLNIQYKTVTKEIRGSIEKYVEFNNGDIGVVTFQDFRSHLLQKVSGV